MQNEVSATYLNTVATLDEELHYGQSYDIIKREFYIGGEILATFYNINGFSDAVVVGKLFDHFIKDKNASQYLKEGDKLFAQKAIPFGETSLQYDLNKAAYQIMCGSSALVVNGINAIIMIDTRKLPGRTIEEPTNDKVLRGPREGFVELLVQNSAMIRKRIRDNRLVCEKLTIGNATKTDVVLCYLHTLADPNLVNKIKEKLTNISTQAINMGQESIAELIHKQEWYNPFPKIRYTERPDTAAACVMEGNIILLCDNYPAAMILPTTIFTFLQDTDDFYFSPIVGTYLKIVRGIVYYGSLVLTPIWYILITNPNWIPEWLGFIKIKSEFTVPIIVQLFIFEIIIDGLKLASLNTPDTLSNSLSIIGALILGEFAVKAGFLVPEVILYMAFVAIANFTQPSYELSYAFKFFRIISLLLAWLFNIWGLIAGFILPFIVISMTKTFEGKSYLYPLIPWNWRAMKRLLFRSKLR